MASMDHKYHKKKQKTALGLKRIKTKPINKLFLFSAKFERAMLHVLTWKHAMAGASYSLSFYLNTYYTLYKISKNAIHFFVQDMLLIRFESTVKEETR